jgi:hypothetical protein
MTEARCLSSTLQEIDIVPMSRQNVQGFGAQVSQQLLS